MHFTLLTIFPEMFPGPLGMSLAGAALEKGLWSYDSVDIRDFAINKHQNVDDKPFGGGAGMVMRPDVLGNAIESSRKNGARLIYMSPRGRIFNQELARELAEEKELLIICGRFEGVDERVLTYYNIEEISIGDYVLSGGEPAAMVLMDSCIRLIPGVVGEPETLAEESFGEGDFAGLLEYPHYTRPAEWKDLKVPEVLLSGNHANIRKWRLEEARRVTEKRKKL